MWLPLCTVNIARLNCIRNANPFKNNISQHFIVTLQLKTHENNVINHAVEKYATSIPLSTIFEQIKFFIFDDIILNKLWFLENNTRWNNVIDSWAYSPF